MEIKILGPGCAKCNKTEKRVREVVAELGANANVEKVTDMMQIAAYGVAATPSVIVDGVLKSSGKVPKKEDLKAWIQG